MLAQRETLKIKMCINGWYAVSINNSLLEAKAFHGKTGGLCGVLVLFSVFVQVTSALVLIMLVMENSNYIHEIIWKLRFS